MRKILALALLAFALAGGLTTVIASYAQAGGGSCEISTTNADAAA